MTSKPENKVANTLTLPGGVTLKNRLAKAAMTEGLADAFNRPTDRHLNLYRRWADGGAALIITGNVQVDRRYLERPGNVVIDRNEGEVMFRAMAKAATGNGAHAFVQINHPGRQAGIATEQIVAPSEVPLIGVEGTARMLSDEEIHDIIDRFAHVAAISYDCGFSGVQVHAAHGYLLSQFLSPLTNKRTDIWGGSLENRTRALLEVIRAIRAATGPDYPISVKLNSADFQRGGLTEAESLQVIAWLNKENIALLEISGGNYESQVMVGEQAADPSSRKVRASTLAREAYFLEFAARAREQTSVPLMVTGGFRSIDAMQAALEQDALDIIGLARPLCVEPALCSGLLTGKVQITPSPDAEASISPEHLSDIDPSMHRLMEVQAFTAYYFNQIRRLAEGLDAEQAPIDWLAQLRSHQALDGADAEAYFASFKVAP